ncbi:hypothetical protein MSG28_014699 [Choristoneura fumiferana]|uniref:Uncharacterized protein n=2 Tax=Choristoneura fumiferana TaxID=7141 RepID=A0ACC0JSE5_CHOFU|nr:hypothetical protein MSG28_014699 [Choristoneura fumiferana]
MDMDVGDEIGDEIGDDDDGGWLDTVRKSIRIKMKKEKADSPVSVKPRALKRGPHKRRGRPPRARAAADSAPEDDTQTDSWTTETAGVPFKVRRVPCPACDLHFTSKVELAAHRARAHPAPRPTPRPKGDKSSLWVCEFCGKTFTYQSSHYSHLRSHLPPVHACPQCEYRTWHRHDLTKHMRIHSGEKNYQCAICANSFYNSSNLLSHMRRTHERSRPHACAQCPKRFYDRTKLRRHQDSHDAIKRFECDVCHSCFTRRCYWKKHLQKQHGVVIPPARCGRKRLNYEVGEDLIDAKKDWPALLRDSVTVPSTEEGMEQTDKRKIS